MMRHAWRTVLFLQLAAPAFAAEKQSISVELNGGEVVNNRCQLTFVIENKSTTGLDSLRLDMFVFNQENRVFRQMVTELGPVRAEKTMVKRYAIEGNCSEIRSILVNDVTACAPAKAEACLDNLALTSSLKHQA